MTRAVVKCIEAPNGSLDYLNALKPRYYSTKRFHLQERKIAVFYQQIQVVGNQRTIY